MSNLKQLHEVFQDERLQLPPIDRPEKWAEQLDTFLGEWARWNDKINLTSESDVAAVIHKHIFDSLQYCRAMKGMQSQVMDIGSGAGFPGIPLKVIFPGFFLVIVESQRKRANFLRNCVRKMELDNIQIINQRSEHLGANYLERFDMIMFRGVGNIAHCLKLAEPFLKNGGTVALKKEPEARPPEASRDREYNFELREEISLLGWTGISSKLMLFEKCST